MKTILLYVLLCCPVFGQPEITGIWVKYKQPVTTVYLAFTTPCPGYAYNVQYRSISKTNWIITPTTVIATGPGAVVSVVLDNDNALFRIVQTQRPPRGP